MSNQQRSIILNYNQCEKFIIYNNRGVCLECNLIEQNEVIEEEIQHVEVSNN